MARGSPRRLLPVCLGQGTESSLWVAQVMGGDDGLRGRVTGKPAPRSLEVAIVLPSAVSSSSRGARQHESRREWDSSAGKRPENTGVVSFPGHPVPRRRPRASPLNKGSVMTGVEEDVGPHSLRRGRNPFPHATFLLIHWVFTRPLRPSGVGRDSCPHFKDQETRAHSSK